LAQSKDSSLRELVDRALPQRPATGREEVIRQRQNALKLTGSAVAGAEVFNLTCATCHRLDGQGSDVGPDLASLQNKDADYWLKNILDPNAIVEPRSAAYLVRLKDQRALAGLIKSETANSLTVMMPGGIRETILRSQVDQLEALPQSLMPEGLELALTDQQLADLIAFLRSTSGLKEADGNQPALITSAPDGSAVLTAEKAEIRGAGDITYESGFGNIGMWHAENDSVTWTVDMALPGTFDLHLNYACAAGSAGNSFRLVADKDTLTQVVQSTGPNWAQYRQVKAGAVKLAAGRQKITLRPQGPVRGALFDLRAVALTPSGVQPHWPSPK
jgi:putative heme-binding domain-containing protein